MTASMRELIENHVELTRKLERANEELKRKDQLKNEFINIARSRVACTYAANIRPCRTSSAQDKW